jgi:phosphomannomutase
VRHDDTAAGAVMLTGDHRGPEFFGLRVRNADGSGISSRVAAELEDLIGPNPPAWAFDAEKHLRVEAPPAETCDMTTVFLSNLAAQVDVDAIRAANLTCLVDPLFGTARGYAARLLRSVGVHAQEIHSDLDPSFGGLHPEVVEPNLFDLEQFLAAEHESQLGIAIDGPSNRAMCLTEQGQIVPPPKMYALLMEHLVRHRGETGRIVAPQTISSIVRRQAKRLGLAVQLVPADAARTRDEVHAGGVLMAGDGLGGLCIPSIDLERNALATAVLMAEMLALHKTSLSQLVKNLDAKLGEYYFMHRDMYVDAGQFQVLLNLLPGLNPGTFAGNQPDFVSHADGLHVQYPNDVWLLVRPSQTQSLVRVYAEAPTRRQCLALLAQAEALIKDSYPGVMQ